MNEIVVFWPIAGRSTLLGKLFRRLEIQRWLHMRLASEITRSPAFPFCASVASFFSILLSEICRDSGAADGQGDAHVLDGEKLLAEEQPAEYHSDDRGQAKG